MKTHEFHLGKCRECKHHPTYLTIRLKERWKLIEEYKCLLGEKVTKDANYCPFFLQRVRKRLGVTGTMKVYEFHYEDIEELNEESAKKFKQKYDKWFHPVIKYNTEEGIQIDTIRKDFLRICTEEFLTLLSVHGDRKVLCYIDSCNESIMVDFRDGGGYDLDVLSNEMLHAIVDYVGATEWGVACYYYDIEEVCLGIKYSSKK